MASPFLPVSQAGSLRGDLASSQQSACPFPIPTVHPLRFVLFFFFLNSTFYFYFYFIYFFSLLFFIEG